MDRYTDYWNAVIGDRWTPAQAVVEFYLVDNEIGDVDSYEDWLLGPEIDALIALGLDKSPDSWERHRTTAARELRDAHLAAVEATPWRD